MTDPLGLHGMFREYFPPTRSEINKFWTSATVVVDTNVLLSLYRTSEATSKTLGEVLASLSDRLWMPNQVGLEYSRNRLGVVYGMTAPHDQALKNLQALKQTLLSQPAIARDAPRHPKKVIDKLAKRIDQDIDKLTKQQKALVDLGHKMRFDDPHLISIESWFGGRIGPSYDTEATAQKLKLAAERLGKKIPPGFADANKGEAGASGDYFVWSQIMDHAKANAVDVMFVTDDLKEDWWLRVSGNTIGPLPALIREFRRETGQDVHFYRSSRFVEEASDRLDLGIGAKQVSAAVSELKGMTFVVPLPNVDWTKLIANTPINVGDLTGIGSAAARASTFKFDVPAATEIGKILSAGIWERSGMNKQVGEMVSAILKAQPDLGSFSLVDGPAALEPPEEKDGGAEDLDSDNDDQDPAAT
jgi:hypothetical protein